MSKIISTNLEETAVPLLTGNWLKVGRAVWVVLAILAGIVLLTSLPAYAQTFGGELAHITERNQNNITAVFAALSGIASLATALLSYSLAILFFRRRFAERVAAGLAFYLLLYAVIMAGPMEHWSSYWLDDSSLALRLQSGLIAIPTIALLVLFPNGRFVPTWSRWVLVLIIPVALTLFILPIDDPTVLTGTMSTVVMGLSIGLMGCYALGFYAQYLRYRRVSSTIERQQTKWVVYGLALWLVYMLLSSIPYYYLENLPPEAPIPWWAAISVLGWFVSLSIVPICLTVAVMRYRLWDIDILINRTLVYGVLTAVIISLYALVIGGMSVLFQTQENGVVTLIATGFVAVLFQPIRGWLQKEVNRLLYGRRDEPFEVLADLGQRLEGSISPDTVYPTIVETVAETLKLPYVAIVVPKGGRHVTAVSTGKPVDPLISYPLTYQSEEIGQLKVAPRPPESSFNNADDRILRNIARQAGTAVHAVQLTADLQKSRQQIVSSREEERRRLRRDLHDGLGPSLAAQMLKIGSARALLKTQPELVDQLLAQMETDIESTLNDVRRIVYDLRPPELDQLGLSGAIQAFANQYSRNGLQIDIHLLEACPALPAAVEVAAYRIAQEGLTNVVHHAQATHCKLRMKVEEGVDDHGRLTMEICDNGRGLPQSVRAGVGLTSMRERSEELGGIFLVESANPQGTKVTAVLPIIE